MNIEDSLRTQLRQQSDAVVLPDRAPDRAVARARQRRRRQRCAVGAVAAGALVVGLVPVLSGGDEPEREVDVASAGVLPPTGPLTFDWQVAGDGLSTVSTSFQAGDGTIYALSTSPGLAATDPEWTQALYRLAEDGTWQPVDLTGDRPSAIDVAAGGDALYAVSTGPGAAEGTSVAQVSTSGDGGDTWTVEDLPEVAPPSDDVTWLHDRYLSVETVGDTTIALVTTSFRLDVKASFPELGDGYAETEPGPDGVLVNVVDSAPGADGPAPATTTTTLAPTDDAPDPAVPDPPTTVVGPDGDDVGANTTTVPWDELGLSGPEDLGPVHQVVRNVGDGWEPVDGVTGLTGNALTLGTSGDRFVADSFGVDGMAVLTSDDGTTWSPVRAPDGGGWSQVASFGPALVAAEPGSPGIQVSTDLGGTWQSVDLAAAGVPDGALVQSLDAGPLGVAVVVAPNASEADWDPMLVTSGDLVDWTVTPIEDEIGADAGTTIGVTVGADRVVLTTTLLPSAAGGPAESRTLVGTPVRD